METIAISNRFFKHELNNYSNWRQAFWREFIQNSVDAKAKNIQITLEALENGHTKIIVRDDGPGMSEATMRDVYFQLGETTKTESDNIGGHGRARILTCFAHEDYTICTQNLLCHGQGGRFEIDNTLPYQKGCTVTVTLSASYRVDMEEALTSYLETCQLPPAVTINEIPFTNWLYRRAATRAVSFGSLHVTKHAPRQLLARVRGVTMFKHYLDCDVGVILEIHPEIALKVLPVSRDSLKYEQNTELQKLTAEIALDHQSIQRDCLENRTEIFGNLKPFRNKRARKEAEENQKNHNESMVSTLAGHSQTTYHGTHPQEFQFQSAAYTGIGQNLHPGSNHLNFLPEQPKDNLPDLALHFEDAPKALISLSKRFERKNIAGTRLKMFRAWEAAVEFFLEILTEFHSEQINYLPGFIFSTTNQGMNVPQPNNGCLILINPINNDGKLAFSIHDHEKLFSLALHECAHVACRGHNEYFSNLQTTLTQLGLQQLSEFKSQIKEAISKKSEEPEVLPPNQPF